MMLKRSDDNSFPACKLERLKGFLLILFSILIINLATAITIHENTQFQPSDTNTTFIFGNNLSFDLVEVYLTYLKLDNNTISVNSSVGSVNITIFNFTNSYKKWNETASDSGTIVNHTISSFSSGDKVVIDKDNVYWNTFISNSSGYINFAYDEGFSIITFEARVDNIHPTPSFSCSPTFVYARKTMTCLCSATDNLDSSPTLSYTINPPTLSTGTFTTTCTATDDAGNSATASISYIVSPKESRASSSGSSYTNTIVKDKKEFSEIKTIIKELKAKERVRIKIEDEEHHIGVAELTNTTATIEIFSSSQKTVFNIGDENKFEVTNDDYYDIYVKLNSISDNKANLTIISIHEEIPFDEKPITDEVFEEQEEVEEKDLTWLWIVIGLVILIGIGVGVKYRKKL